MKRCNQKMVPVALTALALALAACKGDDGSVGPAGADGAQGPSGVQGPAGPAGTDGQDLTKAPKLARLATVPKGAEITGLYKTDNGEVFFNVQHPSDTLPAPENDAAVGVIENLDFDTLDPRLVEVAAPDSSTSESQTVQVADGSYRVLGRAGDTYAGGLPFGLGAISDGAQTTLLKQSQNPDFNAFVATVADGSEGYLFTAWEDRPGSMSRLKLARDGNGEWSVDSSDVLDVDFSNVQGTMINCFGTLSPWGTPLTSEENYEAENAENWNNAAYMSGYPNYTDVQLIQDYLGGTFPNPYRYGYIVEVTQPKSAAPVPVKHFTLGRMAHENAVVMPDRKTVYLTDDGSYKGFYKFVADAAGDLSAGTLYAAKVSQDATTDPAKAGFDIEWIELASSNNTDIEAFIANYDGIDESDYVDGATSYVTQQEIDDWAAGLGGDDAIAFVESLRAAKAKGATMEFNKMEGIDINYDGAASGAIPFMYVAMSDISGGMSDSAGDIQLDTHRCGAVYRFGLTPTYDITRMEPVVIGGEYNGSLTENQCPTDGVSNPDNLIVLDDGRVLIGEDTSKHVNNMLWVYNPQGQ